MFVREVISNDFKMEIQISCRCPNTFQIGAIYNRLLFKGFWRATSQPHRSGDKKQPLLWRATVSSKASWFQLHCWLMFNSGEGHINYCQHYYYKNPFLRSAEVHRLCRYDTQKNQWYIYTLVVDGAKDIPTKGICHATATSETIILLYRGI